MKSSVAPVRERGLKFQHENDYSAGLCRSRKGAWIEITTPQGNLAAYGVAPVRERGLKFKKRMEREAMITVAPVRERGLKFEQGSVVVLLVCRSRKGAWIEIQLIDGYIGKSLSLP